jgi:hypothetical protein
LIRRRAFVISALPDAQARNYEESPTPDPARPAVGEWVGFVSWNNPIVNYGWTMFPDGTFVSGRLERGENGGGAWSTRGAVLTLKYADGFRYEGELHGDAYGGTAYTAEGREFGGFSMWRARKNANVEESP